MSIPLRIVIVHPTMFIARGLMMDLRKIGTVMEYVEIVQTLESARTKIEQLQPHVVFLGLNLPNGGAFELLEQFPPTPERSFAIILVDDTDTPHRARQRHLEAMAEHQAAGYLLYPIFHNGTLGKSMEHARNRLQSRMLSEQQHDIIERLVRGVVEELPNAEAEPTATKELPTLEKTFSVATRSLSAASKPSARKKSPPKGTSKKKPTAKTSTTNLSLTLPWSSVIRLQMKENYYELWYFDTEGAVQTVLVRKNEFPHPSEMPKLLYQAHRSHIVNMKQIAEVNPASLLMRCGSSVPLAESEQYRLQTIVQQMSVQVAVLDELRAMIRKKN
jgi:DNA-binding LytR/AlgR family response regulator